MAVGVCGRCGPPLCGKAADPFLLHTGEHIAIIGNTLAERMQYDGWLETMLHARFPKHDLVIRNLGFSGDEIITRLRSKNFGTPDEWLSGKGAPIGGYEENRFAGTNTKADVVFAFFGYNESYAGQEGLDAFKQQLDDWITHTLAQKYNGKSAPRIVLFSPIAHEDLHNPDLPDGEGEQPAAAAVHEGDGGGRRGAQASRSSISSRRAAQLVCRGEDAADHQWHPPEQRWQPADRRGDRPRAVRRGAGARRSATSRHCGRRSSTRTCTGSTATGRPTGSRPSAIARS